MSDILSEIAAYAEARAAADKKKVGLSAVKTAALSLPKGVFAFERALEGKRALICEIKKASPSKGVISPEFPYREIAAAYELAGADCLSVLTEPRWFLGGDEIFRDLRARTRLPMLRKDFTVDVYQLYQAKLMGADAALLIVALLGARTREFLAVCDELGLTALVETRDEREIELAARCGARVIGVNNRNLRDFSVDLGNAARLKRYIPKGALFVAESGVASPADAASLFAAGADGVLIGEALMKADGKAEFIRAAKGG